MHLKKGQIDKRNGMARKYHLGHRDPIFLDQKILKQNINQYTVVHITVQFYLQISSRYSGSIFKSIYLRVYVLEFYLLISLTYSSSIFKHIQIFQEFYLQISSTIVVLPRRFPQTITVHLDQHSFLLEFLYRRGNDPPRSKTYSKYSQQKRVYTTEKCLRQYFCEHFHKIIFS